MTDSVNRTQNAAKHLNELADQIQGVIDEFPKMSIADRARFFFQLKEAYADLDKARKRIYAHVDALNKHHIPEMLENAEMDKIQLPDLGRSFYILTKNSCSMVDKDAAMSWLRDRGDGALIQETVNAGTLASYMKDLITNEGIDPPEELFKVSTYNTTGISKYTPKG